MGYWQSQERKASIKEETVTTKEERKKSIVKNERKSSVKDERKESIVEERKPSIQEETNGEQVRSPLFLQNRRTLLSSAVYRSAKRSPAFILQFFFTMARLFGFFLDKLFFFYYYHFFYSYNKLDNRMTPFKGVILIFFFYDGAWL